MLSVCVISRAFNVVLENGTSFRKKNCKPTGTNHFHTVCISILHCKWQGLCCISASHKRNLETKLIYPVDTCCVSGEKLIDKCHVANMQFLRCCHTSLLLDALLLCTVNSVCSSMVRAQQHCHDGLIADVAPELNRIQLSAICRCRQSGKVIYLLARHCLPLGHPLASSGTCAVVQTSPSKQCVAS